MPASVTTNVLGVDLFAAYDAISVSTPENPGHPHVYGTRVQDNNGGEWVFGKLAAGATVDRGNCVTMGNTFEDVTPTVRGTGVLLRGRRPGWYQGSTQLTAGMAGWFILSGPVLHMKLASGCLPNVNLYTTDTSGVLDDAVATGSQFPIRGAHAVATQSGSTASNVAGIATFPTIGGLAEAF